MIVFPAVDIQGGHCVRLKQGRAGSGTVFSNSPLEIAKQWCEEGASWLHIIDLDGAFEGIPTNLAMIRDICSQVPAKVQVGGGIRDMLTATSYLRAGVDRIIIGTIALEQPELFRQLCAAHPGRVGVSLDAENGRLKTKGWVEDSGVTVREALPKLIADGAAFVVYTDIERDGMQTGVNVDAMEKLCAISSIPVIAAGGVTALDDIRQLYPLSLKGQLEGIISGRALYEGTLKLRESIAWIDAQQSMGNPSVYKD